MKILLLSRYDNLGASSRYRSYQYLPYLQQQGFEITVAPLLDNNYIKNRHLGQKTSSVSIINAYQQRVYWLLKSQKYDLVWLEKEAFPWIPHCLESLLFCHNIPYVVDYDDAVFHRYDQHVSPLVRYFLSRKIDRVMRNATLVIAGNSYLEERAIQAGAKWVEVLPTVVDLNLYPLSPAVKNTTFTIGWICSPLKSYDYLKELYFSLREICIDDSVRVVAIGAAEMQFDGVSLEVKPWSESTEVQDIQKFDVGIMPLTDTYFERGKCGFKLIQYMASTRAVIGSSIGVNDQIIQNGINGFKANNVEQWTWAFHELKNNPELRKNMGLAGRKIVEEEYCLQIAAPKLANLLQKAGQCSDRKS